MANSTVNIDIKVQSKSLLELEDQLDNVNEGLQEIGTSSDSLKQLDSSLAKNNQQVEQFDKFLSDMVQLLGSIGVESDVFKKIEKDTEQATKEAKKLGDNLEDVGEKTKEAGKEATIFDDVKGKFKDLTAGLRKVVASFKTLKGAIAATGIGALLIAFTSLIAYFKSSEEGSKKFAIALETVKLLFNDLIEFASSLGEGIVNAFKNPKQALIDFKDAFVANIVERFNSFLDTLGFIASSVKKVFKGDFTGALEDVKNAGKEMVDVFTGVPNTLDKVAEVGVKTFKRVKEAVEEAVVVATTLIDAQRALRDTQQELIVQNAQLNKSLEEQRKIAEDTTLDYETRKAALEEVNNIQLQLAQNVANEAKQVEDLLKLQIQNAATYEEREELETQLAEATAARIEAETTLQTVQQESGKLNRELDLEELDRKRSIQDMINALELEGIENEFERARQELDIQEQAALQELDLLKATEEEKQAVRDAYQSKREQLSKEESEYNKALAQAENNAKLDIAKQAFGAIASLVGEQSGVGKAAAIAAATIDTYQAANNALANTPLPPPFPQIAAGAAIVAGLANVRSILQTEVPGENGTGGTAPGVSTPSGPNFGRIGGFEGPSIDASQLRQIPQVTAKEPTVKAYVLAGSVTSAQEADAKLNKKRTV